MIIDWSKVNILESKSYHDKFCRIKNHFSSNIPFLSRLFIKSNINPLFLKSPTNKIDNTALFVKKELGNTSIINYEKKHVTNLKNSAELTQLYRTQRLNFSKATFSLRYPHTCKKIFVHFAEKTNLLLRSDNNTEFSVRKILQTTTI